MKRFVLAFLSVCMILVSLSGCQTIGNSIGSLVAPLADLIPVRRQAKEAKTDISQKMVQYFNEKNREGLMSLLCHKTQGIADLGDQIQASFDFIKGQIVSYDPELKDADEEQFRENGEIIRFDHGWFLNRVTTDRGEEYTIYVHMFVLDTDEDREGVSYLRIMDAAGTEQEIGYRWTTYNAEGSTLAHRAIQAISDGDVEALQALFCQKSLNHQEIIRQMQEGFSFFKGKATFGEDPDSPGRYDGNHDFRVRVEDDEVIENGQPVRTYISVFCENIETDILKTYQLELYAYLLYTDDTTYEGISQIVIRDGTEECVIGE